MNLRELSISEMTPDFIRNNIVYAKIGDNPLMRADNKSTINVSCLYRTKWYVEVKEEKE